MSERVRHIRLPEKDQERYVEAHYKVTRVVTPAQYKQGWLSFLKNPRPMKLVKKLPDGNYLVEEPEL